MTGKLAYINQIEVNLRALPDVAKDLRLGYSGLIVGGIKYHLRVCLF
jgi:hypothetical protein